jgi:NADH-quinone oxidoreductase subunit N
VAHAGFILAPFAMAGAFEGAALQDAFFGSLTYLLVYAFMNLGAFAAVIAVAERTGSAEVDDWAGLARYSPALASLLGVFFFSLAGIPPLAGWFAKFVMFKAVLGDGGGGWGVALAVVAAVNAVIALFFYARVLKVAFMDPTPAVLPEGASASRPLAVALAVTAAVTLAAGFYPQMLAFFSEAARALALP